MLKKSSLFWYGLAVFLVSGFNMVFAMIHNAIRIFDVVLFIFGIFILMLSILTKFRDE